MEKTMSANHQFYQLLKEEMIVRLVVHSLSNTSSKDLLISLSLPQLPWLQNETPIGKIRVTGKGSILFLNGKAQSCIPISPNINYISFEGRKDGLSQYKIFFVWSVMSMVLHEYLKRRNSNICLKKSPRTTYLKS